RLLARGACGTARPGSGGRGRGRRAAPPLPRVVRAAARARQACDADLRRRGRAARVCAGRAHTAHRPATSIARDRGYSGRPAPRVGGAPSEGSGFVKIVRRGCIALWVAALFLAGCGGQSGEPPPATTVGPPPPVPPDHAPVVIRHRVVVTVVDGGTGRRVRGALVRIGQLGGRGNPK